MGVQGAQNWQKDTEKQQLTASSLLLLVLRDVVPALPRPVDMPDWRYLKKGGGEDAIFLVRTVRTSKQSTENNFTAIKAVISLMSPFRDSPCPFLPSHPQPRGPALLSQPPHTLQHCSLHVSQFHLPNFQSSPELHLCLHLCAYLLCSHPGLHPCPFLYQSDFTRTRLHGFSHALLHAHTGPLEPNRVPVEGSSKVALLGFSGARNRPSAVLRIPCVKNFPFPRISCPGGADCDSSVFSVPSGCQSVANHLNTWRCLPAVQNRCPRIGHPRGGQSSVHLASRGAGSPR